MKHIEEARNTADALEIIGTSHPRHNEVALRGILHALLALHDQAEAKPATRTKAAPKETSK